MAYQTTWDVKIVVVSRGKPASDVSDLLNQGYDIRGFTADNQSHSVLLIKKTLPD
ncbi:hypothetical protein LCGC14_2850430, partial [marine sediment metagenome]